MISLRLDLLLVGKRDREGVPFPRGRLYPDPTPMLSKDLVHNGQSHLSFLPCRRPTIAVKCRYGIHGMIPPFELAKLRDLVIPIDPWTFLIINETQEGIGKAFDFAGRLAAKRV